MSGLSGNLLVLVFSLIALIVAITIHEFSHALAAERLGDPTPKLMGRLTLNPLPHIDLFGTILLPLLLAFSGTGIMIGWAKPVQFDAFNLRRPRRDSAIISLAGPVSNFLFAVVCAVLVQILFIFRLTLLSNAIIGSILPVLIALLVLLIRINVTLGVFNLIPIHPLDGFKIVEGILSEEYAHQWHELERYGMLFLLFLIFPIFGGTSAISRVISPVINFVLTLLLPGGQFI